MEVARTRCMDDCSEEQHTVPVELDNRNSRMRSEVEGPSWDHREADDETDGGE